MAIKKDQKRLVSVILSVVVVVATLVVLLQSSAPREEAPQISRPKVVAKKAPSANSESKEQVSRINPQVVPEVAIPSPGEITPEEVDDVEDNVGDGGEAEIPEEMKSQLGDIPIELPPDLKAQLEEPPPELPDDLKAQLNAPPPPLPEDILRAMETPPRIVTEEEVNTVPEE